MSDSLFAAGGDIRPEVEDLTGGLLDAGRMAGAFSAELRSLREGLGQATRDLGGLERGLAGALGRAIDGLVVDGGRLSDALAAVGRAMVDGIYAAALKPVTERLGGLVVESLTGVVSHLLPHARGASFSQGQVMPFAKGGIVSRATMFPMRGGLGLMGESGPEAIMPLMRGPDGRLGVQAAAGRATQVTINVTTPDVAGFARSQAQIAAEMSRLLGRGARNR